MANVKELFQGAWKVADTAFENTAVKITALVTGAFAGGAAAANMGADDRKQRQKSQVALEQEQDAALLKLQLAQKRQKMSEESAKMGARNRPSGNFRAMVSRNPLDGPNTQAPDPNTGQPVEIVAQTQVQ